MDPPCLFLSYDISDHHFSNIVSYPNPSPQWVPREWLKPQVSQWAHQQMSNVQYVSFADLEATPERTRQVLSKFQDASEELGNYFDHYDNLYLRLWDISDEFRNYDHGYFLLSRCSKFMDEAKEALLAADSFIEKHRRSPTLTHVTNHPEFKSHKLRLSEILRLLTTERRKIETWLEGVRTAVREITRKFELGLEKEELEKEELEERELEQRELEQRELEQMILEQREYEEEQQKMEHHNMLVRIVRFLLLLFMRLETLLKTIRLFSNFSEFPDRRRPPCTTMPWSIWPSLVVLWGVCWMFYTPSGSSPLDKTQATINEEVGFETGAVFDSHEATLSQNLFGFPDHQIDALSWSQSWDPNFDLDSMWLSSWPPEMSDTCLFPASFPVLEQTTGQPLPAPSTEATFGSEFHNHQSAKSAYQGPSFTQNYHPAPDTLIHSSVAEGIQPSTTYSAPTFTPTTRTTGALSAPVPLSTQTLSVIVQSPQPPRGATGRFICAHAECGDVSFPTLSAWKQHTSRRHTRPFKCPIPSCSAHADGFGSKGDLERHTNSMHAQSSDSASTSSRKQFHCETPGCPRSVRPFARRDNLNDHVARKHGGVRPALGRDDMGEEMAGEVRDRDGRGRKRTAGQSMESVRNVQKRRRLPANETPTSGPANHDDEGGFSTSTSASRRAPAVVNDDEEEDEEEVQQPEPDLQAEIGALKKQVEEWKQKARDLEVRYQEEKTKKQELKQNNKTLMNLLKDR